MHIIPIAWMFVVVLMSLAEATSPDGLLLGALITFVLYGVLPVSILVYVMGAPLRRRRRLRAEAATASSAEYAAALSESRPPPHGGP
jgi:hypothetical protein